MRKKHESGQKLTTTRRGFLQSALITPAVAGSSILLQGQGSEVSIVVDGTDSALKRPPVQWALSQLQDALSTGGFSPRLRESLGDLSPNEGLIVVAGRESSLARPFLTGGRVEVPQAAESLALIQGTLRDRTASLLSGVDERGVVYSLLEMADRIKYLGSAALHLESLTESPANPIRSITRNFQSDVEDKPWFNDRSFWGPYLSMLTTERFNRFSLAFGLGYNAPRDVHDAYFYFTYPFLFDLPGYDVRVSGLPESEREQNFEMLKWIGEETVKRGLQFHVALWNHAYEWIDSDNPNYTIEGLNPQNHGSYCRDALHKLLEECPTINGVTLRAHSESGIPEGSYEFWEAIFEGIRRAGREIEIDIHSKGIEHKLLDMALATGNRVTVSPKYWAEHMGLPYHQASIREMERVPPPDRDPARIETQRRFTRYGYADYLREDREYGVLYRLWPGTQRTLLWGDPALASGYGRYSHFCESQGAEIFEPLSFKGRLGSGLPGGRNAYADFSLRPQGGDWKKHAYTYRLWGRLLYNPDTPPDSWRRFLSSELGAAANSCEEALSHASRILPLVTVTHHPSASNNSYWPEIYADIPIVKEAEHPTYGDTPSPRIFETVSSLDPILFSSVGEFTASLLDEEPLGKYSPLDVARWLEEAARSSRRYLESAREEIKKGKNVSFRRLDIDVSIQCGLGIFFAEKMRAAVAYSLARQTGVEAILDRALDHYRKAIEAWRGVIEVSEPVYREDITYGLNRPNLRGHWKDRLPAFERDLADMEKSRPSIRESGGKSAKNELPGLDLESLLAGSFETRPRCEHLPPASFQPGKPLRIEVAVESGFEVDQVRLYYRHVNQEEAYRIETMSPAGGRYQMEIPGRYTNSPYPLEYFFEVSDEGREAWLYPGLRADLSNQPYFVVRPT